MSRFITRGEPGLLDEVLEIFAPAALDSPLLRVGRLIKGNLFRA